MTKRLLSYTLFLSLCALAFTTSAQQTIQSNGYSYAIGAPPSWVQSTDYTVPTNASGEPVNYLLTDQQTRFKKGSAVIYRHNVEQPMTTEGLESSSKIEIDFNPAYQRLIWHSAAINRGKRQFNKLTPKAITLIQREQDLDNEIVDGLVTAVLMISGTRKGDLIDYAYSIEGRNPIYDNHVFFSSSLGWGVPVTKVSRRFLFEKTSNIQFSSVQLQQAPVITEVDDMVEYRWEIHNTPRITFEQDNPSWYKGYPEVSFTDFANWQAVSDWAAPLYRPNQITAAELTAFIESIRSLPPQEQITQALFFVQNEIRYLGVELGVNSHKPRQPDEVFEKRFGDCKDKTLMLIAILKSLGINAYPALVSTYGNQKLPDELPSPNQFNHVITRVELNDQVYWLDPTMNQQAGVLEQVGYYSYDYALLVGHPSQALTAMPAAPQTLPEINTTEFFNVLAYEAPVDYTITTEYTGAEADFIRAQFSRHGKTEMARKFTNYMVNLYPGLSSAGEIHYSEQPHLNKITTQEFYRIEGFFEREPDTLISNFYAYSIANYLSLPTTIKRKTPIGYYSPVRLVHNTRIQYPEYFNMSLTNTTEAIDTPHFSLHFTEDYRDYAIITRHEYVAKQDFVEAEQSSDHIAALRQAKNLLYKSYLTDYQQNNPSEQTIANFISRLNNYLDDRPGVTP